MRDKPCWGDTGNPYKKRSDPSRIYKYFFALNYRSTSLAVPIMTEKTLVRFGAIAALALCARPVMALDLNLISPFVPSAPVGQPRSDVGVDMKADALDVRGAITTRRAGNTTQVVPQLTSSFALDRDWKLQTKTTFSNWNEQLSAKTPGAVETKLTGRSVLPLVNEIEGVVARDSMGNERKKLRVTMKDATVASVASMPIQLKTNASVEKVDAPNSLNDSLLTSVEATLAQTSSTAANRIGLKYTNQSGETEIKRESAIVSRSWAKTKLLRFGVEWELMREVASWETTNLQNVVRFTWKGSF